MKSGEERNGNIGRNRRNKGNKLCATVSQSWNMLKEGVVLGNRVKSRELMELGMRIRSRRIELKLSQEELAERAGINSNTVSRIEGGQMAMSVETFRKLVAYGFLTRGCPRKNHRFCITPKKDGCISRKAADLAEFWHGQRKILLLDQNLLACKERMELLGQLAASGAEVEFNGGMVKLSGLEECRRRHLPCWWNVRKRSSIL